MSDSRLNWLQQMSDCWPSICCGQSKLQLLRGSRGPSLLQSSPDKSNLTLWFSPHSPLPRQHRKRLTISPEIELKWFMSARHGMLDSWICGDECLWTHRKIENVLCGHGNESQTDLNEKDVWCQFLHTLCIYSCVCFIVGCLWIFSTSGELRCYEAEQKSEGIKFWMSLGFSILLQFCHHFLTLIKWGTCMTFFFFFICDAVTMKDTGTFKHSDLYDFCIISQVLWWPNLKK